MILYMFCFFCWKILNNCKSLKIPHNPQTKFTDAGGGTRELKLMGPLVWVAWSGWIFVHWLSISWKVKNRSWSLKIEASPKCSFPQLSWCTFSSLFFLHVRVEEISSFRVLLQCMTLSCQPHWLWPIGTNGWVVGTAGGGTRWDWSHQEVFQFLKGYLATSHHSIDLRRGPSGSGIGGIGMEGWGSNLHHKPPWKSGFPNWHMGIYRNNSSVWSKAVWVSPFLKYLWCSVSYINISGAVME